MNLFFLPLLFVGIGFFAFSSLLAAKPTPVVAPPVPAGPSPKTVSPATPKAQAQSAAEQWLALADAGQWAKTWDAAATFFQKNVPQAQWEQMVSAVRKPQGALLSRKLKSATYAKSLPGAPDGEYVVLQFETSFANKPKAIETVTPMREPDGTWKISGYFIQ